MKATNSPMPQVMPSFRLVGMPLTIFSRNLNSDISRKITPSTSTAVSAILKALGSPPSSPRHTV